MTIVRTDYRPKRARKKKPAVPLTGPRITTIRQQYVAEAAEAHNAVERGEKRATAPPPDEMPETRPVIVTAKNPRRGRFGDDAAEALFRELVRLARQ